MYIYYTIKRASSQEILILGLNSLLKSSKVIKYRIWMKEIHLPQEEMRILKKIIFVLFLFTATISTFVFGSNYYSYLKYHAMPDGGYVDTPTFVSRYGNAPQTVYLQLVAEKFGKNFVGVKYFESYLETLKKHPEWFSTYNWINSSLSISEYLRKQNAPYDKDFLKAIDRFFEKNLKNYSTNPSYVDMVSDLLIIRNFLGENPKTSAAYSEAVNLLKLAIKGKVDRIVGLTEIRGILNANMSLPKIDGLSAFISNAIPWVVNSKDFQDAVTLIKLNKDHKKFIPLMKDENAISTPQQLYDYIELSEKLNFSYKRVSGIFKTLLTFRAPFGGYYNIGTTSDVHDSYWATKILILKKKTNDAVISYWKGLAKDLAAYPLIYPANILSTYIYYFLRLNNDLHFLSGKEFQSLSNALSSKLNETPTAPAYYLAKSDFTMAFRMLNAIQMIDYKNTKLFDDLNTTLTRLFNGLNAIPKNQKNISYYYIYTNLLIFANDLGYPVNIKNVKQIKTGYVKNLKEVTSPDLTLINTLFKLEKAYGLKIDKSFFINAVDELLDQKTGGYFSDTQAGIETFESTYKAEEMLLDLKK